MAGVCISMENRSAQTLCLKLAKGQAIVVSRATRPGQSDGSTI